MLYIDLTATKLIPSLAQQETARHSRVGGQLAEVVLEVEFLCSGDAVQHSLINLSRRFLSAARLSANASNVIGPAFPVPLQRLQRGVHELHQMGEKVFRELSGLPVPHNVTKLVWTQQCNQYCGTHVRVTVSELEIRP